MNKIRKFSAIVLLSLCAVSCGKAPVDSTSSAAISGPKGLFSTWNPISNADGTVSKRALYLEGGTFGVHQDFRVVTYTGAVCILNIIFSPDDGDNSNGSLGIHSPGTYVSGGHGAGDCNGWDGQDNVTAMRWHLNNGQLTLCYTALMGTYYGSSCSIYE